LFFNILLLSFRNGLENVHETLAFFSFLAAVILRCIAQQPRNTKMSEKQQEAGVEGRGSAGG
jgi:hypothetical protein